jgi:hypothetical protein
MAARGFNVSAGIEEIDVLVCGGYNEVAFLARKQVVDTQSLAHAPDLPRRSSTLHGLGRLRGLSLAIITHGERALKSSWREDT